MHYIEQNLDIIKELNLCNCEQNIIVQEETPIAFSGGWSENSEHYITLWCLSCNKQCFTNLHNYPPSFRQQISKQDFIGQCFISIVNGQPYTNRSREILNIISSNISEINYEA